MPSETGKPDSRWSWGAALCGVVPPMISPLSETGEPDGDALLTLVGHILDGGCSGLFVLGGCGEGAWLTGAQRASVVRGAIRAAAGRVPVLVGIMLPATGLAMDAARQAADEGADALVVGSPYYLGVDAATQQRHVEAILGAVSLPILLYNIPQATHNPLAPATALRLAQDSRILGIKDSAGDFEAFQGFLAIKRTRADFRVLQGHEAYAAASLLLGGDGLVPGMANFAPDLFVTLHRAATKADAAACAKLQEQITDLCTLHTHGHWLPALKAACAICGLGNGVPTPPLAPATIEERRAIDAILARHGFPRPQ
ncbi:MAG: dihydrodipicolinate synthase family protein [candidate division NC10 bacterium]